MFDGYILQQLEEYNHLEVTLTGNNDNLFSQSTYGILAILSEGSKTGYDIKKFLSAPEVFYWRESYGNIYPILRSLKDYGFVLQIDSDIKKKRRIFYEITDEGRKELLNWIVTPPDLTRFRVELLMKLRFGEIAGIDIMKSHIEHYRKLAIAEIDECNELIDSLNEPDMSFKNTVRSITALYMVHFKEAMNNWCTESIETLDRWLKKHPSTE